MEAQQSFEDPMFGDFSTDTVLNPMGPKAIQQHHHFVTSSHHHHHHHAQPIMIGNGDINQHTRLPAISEIQQGLPGNSPKIEGGHYKTLSDYSHVKIESPHHHSYSPNGKIDYLNGNNTTKLDSYSAPSSGGGSQQQKLEYTSNGQYSPQNSKIIEYSNVPGQQQQHIEQHIQLYHHQSLDQQNSVINGNDGNFKRKSDENLNNLSSSPTPTTIINSSISPTDGNSTTSINKKPSVDKKKNDPNGVKKKKTR